MPDVGNRARTEELNIFHEVQKQDSKCSRLTDYKILELLSCRVPADVINEDEAVDISVSAVSLSF